MMATTVDTRVIVDLGAELELASSLQVYEYLAGIGERIAADARDHAPRRASHSQGGAESIHPEVTMSPTGWELRVSWDKRHWYMRFPELGTKYQTARPFLRPALDRARGMF